MEDYQWRVYKAAIERWPRILEEPIRRQMRALHPEELIAHATLLKLAGGK